jgi:hypothetical protein
MHQGAPQQPKTLVQKSIYYISTTEFILKTIYHRIHTEDHPFHAKYHSLLVYLFCAYTYLNCKLLSASTLSINT